MSRFLATIVFPFVVTVAVGLQSCGDDDTVTGEGCPGGCLPGQECNETTGLCEPIQRDSGDDIASDVSEDDAEDTVGVDVGVEDQDVLAEIEEEPLTDAEPSDTDASAEPDATDVPVVEPTAVSSADLTLAPDPPVSISIMWDYPDDQSVFGFEIRVNGEIEATYGTSHARSHRTAGHLPGEVVQVQVLAYNMDGSEQVYAAPAVGEITNPIPDSIIVSPFLSLYLAADGTDSTAQTEALTVFLQYHAADGFDPRVLLYRAGTPVSVPGLTIGFSVGAPSDLLVATVEDGMVTATGPGEMQFDVTCAWSGDAAGEVTTTVDVEVVDPDDGVGAVMLDWQNVTGEIRAVDVAYDGPESETFECLATSQCSYTNLSPGRYVFELSDADNPLNLTVTTKVVYVRAGEETIVGYSETPRVLGANCESIESITGGTVTSSDGATLTIPPGALRMDGSGDVCVTPVGPAGGPWRGRATISPALLPVSYDIEPSDAFFGAGTVLSIPISSEMETLLATDLTVETLASIIIDGSDWLPGPQATLNTVTHRLDVSIEGPGLYSFLMCPLFGDNPGACHIVYGGCVPSQDFEAATNDTPAACGEGDEVVVSTFEVVDASDGEHSSVADAYARAFGLAPGDGATCTAHPCYGMTPCAPDCRGDATLLGCGQQYSGSIESRDSEGVWDPANTLDIIVPMEGVCHQTFEVCSGGCRSDDTPTCARVCRQGY